MTTSIRDTYAQLVQRLAPGQPCRAVKSNGIEQHDPRYHVGCYYCHGTGAVAHPLLWEAVTTECTSCSGTGRKLYESPYMDCSMCWAGKAGAVGRVPLALPGDEAQAAAMLRGLLVWALKANDWRYLESKGAPYEAETWTIYAPPALHGYGAGATRAEALCNAILAATEASNG